VLPTAADLQKGKNPEYKKQGGHLPLELNQGTAKSVRIGKIPSPELGFLRCYRLTDY
jgi:hypothetical protein